jgi:hypothetical protein
MTAQPQQNSKAVRSTLTVIVLVHLMAVVLPPLWFQTRPSPAVATLLRPVEGYGQFLYIDRGYAFFAPDPGPSYLVQAAITSGPGTPAVERMYPDRQDQWPRLLYHRHFMLTEFLNEIYQPPGPPAELVELDREEAENWVRARSRYEHVRTSYVDHLKHVHPGKDVAIRRVEHLIPNIVEFQREPVPLNDPRLYQVLLDIPINLGESNTLTAPAKPPETIPPPPGEAATVTDGNAVRVAETKPADEKAEQPAPETKDAEATTDNADSTPGTDSTPADAER